MTQFDKQNKIILNYKENIYGHVAQILIFLIPITMFLIFLGFFLYIITNKGAIQIFQSIKYKKEIFIIFIFVIIGIFKGYPKPHRIVINSNGEMLFFTILGKIKKDISELNRIITEKILNKFYPVYIIFEYKNKIIKIMYDKNLKTQLVKIKSFFGNKFLIES